MESTALNIQAGKTEIAANADFDPVYFSEKRALSDTDERFSDDSRVWDELAAKHLDHYTQPRWSAPCTVVEMERWLDRMSKTARDYKRLTNATLAEFIELNPDWPLRAWIGIALETFFIA